MKQKEEEEEKKDSKSWNNNTYCLMKNVLFTWKIGKLLNCNSFFY